MCSWPQSLQIFRFRIPTIRCICSFMIDIDNIPGFFLSLKCFLSRGVKILYPSISILMLPWLKNFSFNMIDFFHSENNIFRSMRT